MDTIGERLRIARTQKNISMAKLEKISGVTSGNISDIENNKKTPGAKAIIELCKSLEITADWLLTGTESIKLSEEEKILLKRYSTLTEREKGQIDYVINKIESEKETSCSKSSTLTDTG